MRVALFPGQGVPTPALLEALNRDHPLLRQASDVLCYDLRERVESFARRSNSPLPTSVAQPAIFTASLIGWERRKRERFDFLLGHSLGEYVALVASGAMSVRHALCVVQVRGAAMERAARVASGGMAAILGLEDHEVDHAVTASSCIIANDNAPGQVVVAGPHESLGLAAKLVKEMGGRCVLLDVSAPFHTAAMAPAQTAVAGVLDHVGIRLPAIPVISNGTARPYAAPGEIRKRLVAQLIERVRFRESLEYLWSRGVTEFADLGPGAVVAGLARRTFDTLGRTEEVLGG